MLDKIKSHIILILVGTILCGFSLGSIVAFTNPASAGIPVFALLYISLFLFSVGVFSLLGIIIRQLTTQNLYVLTVSHSVRQAVLLGILITATLFLKSIDLLHWWVLGLLILFLVFLEIFLSLD